MNIKIAQNIFSISNWPPKIEINLATSFTYAWCWNDDFYLLNCASTSSPKVIIFCVFFLDVQCWNKWFFLLVNCLLCDSRNFIIWQSDSFRSNTSNANKIKHSELWWSVFCARIINVFSFDVCACFQPQTTKIYCTLVNWANELFFFSLLLVCPQFTCACVCSFVRLFCMLGIL